MATRVGFIGLGAMGKPIAANIQQAGFDLMVYDLRAEQMDALAKLGAKRARSPRELGAHAEVIALAVPDDVAVEAALLGPEGAMDGANPGTLIAIHSTVRPDTVHRLAKEAKGRGLSLIDAQMSGGHYGAESRTLCFMVGGEQADFERCKPVLQASGQNIFHLGGLGVATAAKAAQQAITTVNILAAVEGFRLAETAGVDLEVFQQMVAVSAGQSHICNDWLQHYHPMTTDDPRPFYRGLRAVLALARELDVQLPGTALAQQIIPWSLTRE
ncbi:MAG: 2-hydroxy-3-oxopropionate reductase [Chloroflexi bacterium]|nr:2-hydroxy-3-oxopropionate reductase [Chloroflexota bacterium]